MDPIKYDQMEKFRLLASLKSGFMIDTDGEEVWDMLNHLEQFEHYEYIRKNPHEDCEMYTAMMSKDQGITSNDWNQYFEYNREKREKEEEAQREEAEKNIPEVIRLETYNKFQEYSGKQYPTHYHFKFERKVGNKVFEIECRMFKPRYGEYRLWYQWKDPVTNKIERHKTEFSSYHFNLPSWMPEWWGSRWRLQNKHIALAFAHAMTTNYQQSFKNIVKPK